jgi:hypothetical protein
MRRGQGLEVPGTGVFHWNFVSINNSAKWPPAQGNFQKFIVFCDLLQNLI